MKLTWKKYLLYAGIIFAVGLLVWFLIQPILVNNTGFENKTLWDRIQLLVVPAVLALGAFYLEHSERTAEREIAKERHQEQILQSYLDEMTKLLLEKDLRHTENLEIRFVARTRTLTVLRGLDSKRKIYVLQFLKDARLIGTTSESRIIDLEDADFSYADLGDVDLSNVNLAKANLQHANLRRVRTYYTCFDEADMRYANFQDGHPNWSQFYGTDLSYANMRNATFWDMVLKETKLEFADLRGADFTRAAGLIDVDLTGANLKGAKIPEAHLTAKKIKGAIMPDGTKHS